MNLNLPYLAAFIVEPLAAMLVDFHRRVIFILYFPRRRAEPLAHPCSLFSDLHSGKKLESKITENEGDFPEASSDGMAMESAASKSTLTPVDFQVKHPLQVPKLLCLLPSYRHGSPYPH